MSGHGAKFDRKKEDAIAALLSHRNIDDAAAAIGIAPRTLLRWMEEPEFDAAYREARRTAFRQSIGRLQLAASAAVSTLLKIMIDPNAPASTRVRAADSVLDHAGKAIELDDIESRVAALEQAGEAARQLGIATDNEEHSIGGARPQKKIRRVGKSWGGHCR
jgi:type II secretory pathway component GspD/PulD (secretin)